MHTTQDRDEPRGFFRKLFRSGLLRIGMLLSAFTSLLPAREQRQPVEAELPKPLYQGPGEQPLLRVKNSSPFTRRAQKVEPLVLPKTRGK